MKKKAKKSKVKKSKIKKTKKVAKKTVRKKSKVFVKPAEREIESIPYADLVTGHGLDPSEISVEASDSDLTVGDIPSVEDIDINVDVPKEDNEESASDSTNEPTA